MGSRTRLRYAVSGADGLAEALAALVRPERREALADERALGPDIAAMFAALAPGEGAPGPAVVLVMAGHGDTNGSASWYCTHAAEAGEPDLAGEALWPT